MKRHGKIRCVKKHQKHNHRKAGHKKKGAGNERGLVQGCASPCSLLVAARRVAPLPPSAAEFDKYELESVSASLSTTQAGAHADFTIVFELTHEKEAHPTP